LAYIFATESIRVSSTTFTQSAQNATEFGEITQPLSLLRRSRSFKVTEFGTKVLYNHSPLIRHNSHILPHLVYWPITNYLLH